jgi:drug/metabolite transporter (DMT)-like permease
VFLELGFLLVYRAGWNVSVAALTAYVAVAVLLIPVGILLFKENISFLKVLGILFCVLGLILINK